MTRALVKEIRSLSLPKAMKSLIRFFLELLTAWIRLTRFPAIRKIESADRLSFKVFDTAGAGFDLAPFVLYFLVSVAFLTTLVLATFFGVRLAGCGALDARFEVVVRAIIQFNLFY